MFKPGDRIKWVSAYPGNEAHIGRIVIVKSVLDKIDHILLTTGEARFASQFIHVFDLKTLLKTYYEKDGKVL